MQTYILLFQNTGTDLAVSSELFTNSTFATLSGLVFMVFTLCNVVQHIFNFSPKWFGLVVSLILCIVALFLSHPDGGIIWQQYFVAIMNSFLVYSTAFGITRISEISLKNKTPEIRTRGMVETEEKRQFLSSWW
ncbi:MAG: hypothetical protein ACPG5P_07770 [Saprospiraceae bacterium]